MRFFNFKTQSRKYEKGCQRGGRTGHRTAGFTMAETLIVVAIIGILSVVGFASISTIRRNMRQTEMDKDAEIIFEAAQNRLIELSVFYPDVAKEYLYKNAERDGLLAVTEQNDGRVESVAMTSATKPQLLYANGEYGSSKNDNAQIVLSDYLGEGSTQDQLMVSGELYDKGWIVEYNPTSLNVTGVFYYDSDVDISDFYTSANVAKEDIAGSLRGNSDAAKRNRLQWGESHDYHIGYYGGEASDVPYQEDSEVRASVKFINEEELTAVIGLRVSQETLTFDAASDGFYIYVTTTGEESGVSVCQRVYISNGYLKTHKDLSQMDAIVSDAATITVDSLKSGQRFAETYGKINVSGTCTDSAFAFLDKSGDGQKATLEGITESKAITEPIVRYDAVSTAKANENRKDPTQTAFIPGENVVVSVRAALVDAPEQVSMISSGSANSLYADVTPGIGDDKELFVSVQSARHLQNLDKDSGILTSYVDGSANGYASMSAVQEADIYFDRERAQDATIAEDKEIWNEVYKDKDTGSILKFTPIVNDKLKSYAATRADDAGDTSYKISDLIVDPAVSTDRQNLGLFGTFYGSEMIDVELVGPIINGGGSGSPSAVGGIIGCADGASDLTMDGCRVYMRSEDVSRLNPSGGPEETVKNAPWLTGGTCTGGLIGKSVRPVNITNSFAATIVHAASGESYAGGLVGASNLKASIANSYADCYVSGRSVGGLMGQCTSDSVIQDSFSAGFTFHRSGIVSAAGFVPSAVASVTDAYTVLDLGDFTVNEVQQYAGTDATNLSYIAPSVTTATNVYYNTNSDDSEYTSVNGITYLTVQEMKSSSKAALDTAVFAFPSENKGGFSGVTVPYYLNSGKDTQGSTYPYARLWNKDSSDVVDHYGDWHNIPSRFTARFFYGIAETNQIKGNTLNIPNKDSVVDEFTRHNAAYPDAQYLCYPFMEDDSVYYTHTYTEYEYIKLPKKNTLVEGRSKKLLYWQFKYDFGDGEGATDYYYVPSSKDSYSASGRHYYGTFYKAADTGYVEGMEAYATYDSDTDSYKTKGGSTVLNPFESISDDMDVFARFADTTELQSVNLYYHIFTDSSRSSESMISRLVSRGVAVQKEEDDQGKTVYYVEADAVDNVGGYVFCGWSAISDGKNTEGKDAFLTADSIKDSDKIKIILDGQVEDNVYAIFEKVSSHSVNVEYCNNDENVDGWGAGLAAPKYFMFTQLDYDEEDSETWFRKGIEVPTIDGYEVLEEVYFFPEGASTHDPELSIKVQNGSYIDINITVGGTYVVRYNSKQSGRFRVKKIYEHSVKDSNTSIHYTAEDVKSEALVSDVYTGFMVGDIIPDKYLQPDSFVSASDANVTTAIQNAAGFEVDYYQNGAQIEAAGAGNVYECIVYYKRAGYSLYFDLDGGLYEYNNGGTTEKRGYKVTESVGYGASLPEFAGVESLERLGYVQTGWDFYAFTDTARATKLNGSTLVAKLSNFSMPAYSIVAVPHWVVSAKSVKIQIYKQKRTDSKNLADAGTYHKDKNYDLASEVTLGENAVPTQSIALITNSAASADVRYAAVIAAIQGNNNWKTAGLVSNDITNGLYHFKLNATKTKEYNTGVIDNGGNLILSLCYDRATITIKYEGSGDVTSSDISGLYEADFENTTDWRSGYEWIIKDTNTNLTYLSRFFHISLNSTPDNTLTLTSDKKAETGLSIYHIKENNNRTYGVAIGTGYFTDLPSSPVTTSKSSAGYTLRNSDGWNEKFTGYQMYAYYLSKEPVDNLSDITNWNIIDYSRTTDMPVGGGENDNCLYILYQRKDEAIKYNDVSTSYGIKGGGEASLTQSSLYASTVTSLPTATDVQCPYGTGYTFGGWYSDAAHTHAVDKVVVDDYVMQLFAKWTPNAVKVRFHMHLPSNMTELTSKTEPPTMEGEFAKSLAGAGKTALLTENEVLTAAVDKGATLPEGASLSGGVFTIPTKTSDGTIINALYRFDGWYRAEVNGNSISYSSEFSINESLYADTDVYAKWTMTYGETEYQIRCYRVSTDGSEPISRLYPQERITARAMVGIKDGQAIQTIIYAPIDLSVAFAGLDDGDWGSYYPVTTRVSQVFTEVAQGELPEVRFDYKKGNVNNYLVTYNAQFTDVDTGASLKIAFSQNHYDSIWESMSYGVPEYTGYTVAGSKQIVTVSSTNKTDSVTYVPAGNITLSKVLDIPDVSPDLTGIATAVTDEDGATRYILRNEDEAGTVNATYELVTYYYVTKGGTPLEVGGVTTNGYMTSAQFSELYSNMSSTKNGVSKLDYGTDYTVEAEIRLIKRANENLAPSASDESYTVWKSSNSIEINIPEPEETTESGD